MINIFKRICEKINNEINNNLYFLRAFKFKCSLKLKGHWFAQTFFTILLSHLALIVLMLISVYNMEQPEGTFDVLTITYDYLAKGTLFISGLTLIATTLLSKVVVENSIDLTNKENNETDKIKEKNNIMKMIKVLLILVLIIQAILYSVSIDLESLINLNTFQLIISILSYLTTIYLYALFNYFNRTEYTLTQENEIDRSAILEKVSEISQKGDYKFD